ncbi:MAG: bifunctional ornithine acetyltransferase/N-acetylglutamate synthase [Clostridia bacterium]|nr:bifunctional ornithine acetyltransferase/N-acetylglutamate synthase [Clostridia bacterium]
MFEFIEGGVCAPSGFRAGGVHCGIRAGRDGLDLGLIVSDFPASAAAVYTQNLVQGAPIAITREHLRDGQARAVICNSGIANTCCADGLFVANEMCGLAALALGLAESDVIVASTGVIGQSLPLEAVERGVSPLVSALSYDAEGSDAFARAIMTTDTVKKEFAVSVSIDGNVVKIGGVAKGSGMINPNMATMLAFLTTDAVIEPAVLQEFLQNAADCSINRVSVDGDTSTNDMLCILANGASGVEIGTDNKEFSQALCELCKKLARELARDGEGATKLLECRITGAPSVEEARKTADSIINSPLVKTAMFGADANWGRVLCAIGYAGVALDVTKIDVAFTSKAGSITVCKCGAGLDFDEARALDILKQEEIIIEVGLNQGPAQAMAWGCDLTYDYVKINGDYRT